VAGVTIAVGAVPVGGAPAGTIGLGGVDVLVGSECVVGGACCPLGMTMGVDGLPPSALPPASSPETEFCGGGQSTAVGGQLLLLPDPAESPGGGQPKAGGRRATRRSRRSAARSATWVGPYLSVPAAMMAVMDDRDAELHPRRPRRLWA
jgi:hypothetical protein